MEDKAHREHLWLDMYRGEGQTRPPIAGYTLWSEAKGCPGVRYHSIDDAQAAAALAASECMAVVIINGFLFFDEAGHRPVTVNGDGVQIITRASLERARRQIEAQRGLYNGGWHPYNVDWSTAYSLEGAVFSELGFGERARIRGRLRDNICREFNALAGLSSDPDAMDQATAGGNKAEAVRLIDAAIAALRVMESDFAPRAWTDAELAEDRAWTARMIERADQARRLVDRSLEETADRQAHFGDMLVE